VVMPWVVAWRSLYGCVPSRRSARSAGLCRKFWTGGGCPLAVISQAQVDGLSTRLQDEDVRVVIGMRYGGPSIAAALDELTAVGCHRLIVFPMYPQYASATTGSSLERVHRLLAERRVVPSIRTVPPYFEQPNY